MVAPTPLKIRKHGSHRRRGMPSMTDGMQPVLTALFEAYEAGTPWLSLTGVDSRTIRALEAREWISSTEGLDGTRYMIIDGGLKALKVYAFRINRRDNLCPRCGERPRHVTASGRREALCKPCLKHQSKRKRDLKLVRRNPDRLCSRCVAKDFKHKRKVHVYPNGTTSNYCQHCAHIMGTQSHRRLNDSRMKRIEGGEFIQCSKAGCEEPIHHTANRAYNLCKAHWSESSRKKNRVQAERIGRQPWPTSLSLSEVFQRYPFIGTVEHLPYVVKAGQRHFNFLEVRNFARREIPWEIVTCDLHKRARRATIEAIRPEGYAIYRCPQCERRFKITFELYGFWQDEV